MIRSIAVLALAFVLPATAADAEVAQEIKEICQRMCGIWDPAEPVSDAPAMHLTLALDPASGEIRGTKSVDGWDGGAAASLDIVIAYMAETGTVRMVIGDLRVGALVATGYVDPETIVFSAINAGKPDVSSILQYTNPTPDTLHEIQAESAQQYNNMLYEMTYKRAKK